jgi:hypothetical protein
MTWAMKTRYSCTEGNRDSTNLGKTQQQSQQVQFSVPFESVTLDNGLQVIFHVDRSDPVVAVALTSHVRSSLMRTVTYKNKRAGELNGFI